MLAEHLLVHARAVVVALEVRARNEGHEILVAGEVLREEDQVERLPVALDLRVAVEAAATGDVRLDADDRLDAGGLRGRVEVDRAIERPVVGEGEGGHLEGLRAGDEVAQPRHPVEQAVFTVRVQVDERLRDAVPR